MAARKVLYLFDVDGTVTKPRQVIAKDFLKFLLEKVQPQVSIGLVSGSDYVKVSEQMCGEQEAAKFDYLFCENGLVDYSKGKLQSSQSILKYMGEKALQKVINFALRYMSTIELPAKRGNFVEYRTGVINLCPIGRSCSQAERDEFVQFDSVYKVREKFVEALYKEFTDSGLTFALGGQISIDVYPNGWDKTYCLKHVASENFEEIHFFGDKTSPGGNDHEIYAHESTIGYSVTSPEDTKEQLTKLLGIV